MSMCVIQRLLLSALRAIGRDCNISDPWLTGAAQSRLKADAGCAFHPAALAATQARCDPVAVLSAAPAATEARCDPVVGSPICAPTAAEKSAFSDDWLSNVLFEVGRVSSRLLPSASSDKAYDADVEGSRLRDVLPLPACFDSVAHGLDPEPAAYEIAIATATVHGLNFLYDVGTPSTTRILACHRSALCIILNKVRRMHNRLSVLKFLDNGASALAKLVGDLGDDGLRPSAKIVAAKCDLLPCSGLVDPVKFLDAKSRAVVVDGEKLFPSPPAWSRTFRFRKG